MRILRSALKQLSLAGGHADARVAGAELPVMPTSLLTAPLGVRVFPSKRTIDDGNLFERCLVH